MRSHRPWLWIVSQEILALMQVQMPQKEWDKRMEVILKQGSSSIQTKPGYDIRGYLSAQTRKPLFDAPP